MKTLRFQTPQNDSYIFSPSEIEATRVKKINAFIFKKFYSFKFLLNLSSNFALNGYN